jgi:hypothetical protein
MRKKYSHSVIAPVIDAKSSNFQKMYQEILVDFQRYAGITDENLWLIDEAAIKLPKKVQQYMDSIREWVAFLNTLDIELLKKIDTDHRFESRDLVFDESGSKVMDISDKRRIKCTIAELIVYYEKMKHALTRFHDKKKVVLVTGYDETYLFLYGNGKDFQAIQTSLAASLSAHFGKDVSLVDFMYALNPSKSFNPIEYTRPFVSFSHEEQCAIRAANSAYCLASAYYLENIKDTKEIDEDLVSRLRRGVMPPLLPRVRDAFERSVWNIDLTSRPSIIEAGREMYQIILSNE